MGGGVLSCLKGKLGDLWWYTAWLFVAQRIGDVINMFVGLWLVPRYVPMEELGVVLPITAVVGFLALPLTIVVTPFQKFITQFNESGEIGKVKSLIRDVFVGTFVLGSVVFLIAWLVLPFFFERMRVAAGSLGALILAVSIAGAVSGVFGAAVGGVKRFGACAWFALLGAPLRLVVMALTMPFRALSGYVLGQGAPHGVYILGSIWVLRDYFRCDVKCVPYLREHGREILLYALPFALWTIALTFSGSVDALVIRHRLSDFESAGYYVVTRFSEIAGYLGLVFPSLTFPLVASKKKDDANARRILCHSVWGTAICGLVCVCALGVGGRTLLGLTKVWQPYQPLAVHMCVLAANTVLVVVANCLFTFEMAQGRFRFLWYAIPLLAVKCVVLYCLTGYTFFGQWLPDEVMRAIEAFNPCRLSVVIGVLLISQITILLALLADVFLVGDICRRQNMVKVG